MTNEIQSIATEKLIDHPDNPNRMSRANFARLVRNIRSTGRYEPIIVRPHPERQGYFQIINGHHRHKALVELGYKTADAVVWDIDDRQTDILLATLNRLAGSDVLEKKLALLTRLNSRMQAEQLAKLIPQTAKQIERLTSLKFEIRNLKPEIPELQPIVFFVNDQQQKTIENALSLGVQNSIETTRAAKRAAGLCRIAQAFLDTQ